MTQPLDADYRLIYHNSRGAAEPIRLLLAISGADWQDVRYPLGAARSGFALHEQYIRARDAGAFAANMDSLPVLLVREDGGANWMLGQSHAIARFVARRHGLLGSTPREEAAVDCLVECVRDIRASWYKVKATPAEVAQRPWWDVLGAKGEERSGAARHAAKQSWWASGLPEACTKLERAAERAAPPRGEAAGEVSGEGGEGAPPPPWLVGGSVTLADVVVYHLLSTPMSVASGCVVGFFDGEAEPVREALESCPRLAAVVAAVGALPAVREWEMRRPDTFS